MPDDRLFWMTITKERRPGDPPPEPQPFEMSVRSVDGKEHTIWGLTRREEWTVYTLMRLLKRGDREAVNGLVDVLRAWDDGQSVLRRVLGEKPDAEPEPGTKG